MSKRRTRSFLASAILLLFSLTFMPAVHALEGAAPVIKGDPITVPVGESYDPLAGLTITDDTDPEALLLSKVIFYDYGDPLTVGAYDIFYFVTDSDGNEACLYRPVLVMDPEFPLIYAKEAGVAMGEIFNPLEGVIAYDELDGYLTEEVRVLSGSVDTSVPGEYQLILEVWDSQGNRAEAMKTVYVYWPEEYFPVITAPDIFILLGSEFDVMQDVTASDKTDGDLTASIMVDYSEVDPTTPGIYWTQYTVKNSLGLVSYEDRRVMVIDGSVSPVILAQEVQLETGMHFDPLDGVFAYDLEDGDITQNLVVAENTVDTSQAGDYVLRYTVTDSDGNTAELSVSVHVEWSYEYYPHILLEKPQLFLPVNGQFDPLDGVTASDPNDGDLTDKIVVNENNVDTSMAGEYFVEYTVTNSRGISTWEMLYVYVLDSSIPVLSVYDFTAGLNEELDIYMVHMEAYDLEDGDLRESVTWDISQADITTAGTYPVKFQVVDSSGNLAEATCTVTIIDYSYPELYVYDHTAYLDSEYDPLDFASAWDSMDGDLTEMIVVEKNTVKLKKPGIYYVTYSVTDSENKTTTSTVSVEVMKEPVMSFYLTYQGMLIPIDTDEAGNMAFISSDVLIPAGEEVGIGVFADGEPVFEYLGIINVSDILPGLTYSILITEDSRLVTEALPYLYNGKAYRLSPMEGEVEIKSASAGTLYYVSAESGATLPDIDTSIGGIPIEPGLNRITLSDLTPGKAEMVRMIVVTEDTGVSNLYEIEIPKTPSRQNKEDPKPPEKNILPTEADTHNLKEKDEPSVEEDLTKEEAVSDPLSEEIEPLLEEEIPAEEIPVEQTIEKETPERKILESEEPQDLISLELKIGGRDKNKDKGSLDYQESTDEAKDMKKND